MKQSTDRILTTHVGSLIRPKALQEHLHAKRISGVYDETAHHACLIETVAALGSIENEEVGRAASVLRALSGLYDQAARAATAL